MNAAKNFFVFIVYILVKENNNYTLHHSTNMPKSNTMIFLKKYGIKYLVRNSFLNIPRK